MKLAAMILGLIGGLIALVYGFIGHGLGSVSTSGGGLQVASIILPAAILLGAGIVIVTPAIGASIMSGAAVAFIAILGFNTFTMVPVVILAIASLLGFLGAMEHAKSEATDYIKCPACNGSNTAADTTCRYCKSPLPIQEAIAPSADSNQLAEQIIKIKELHASGILSDAEFQSAKAKLLCLS